MGIVRTGVMTMQEPPGGQAVRAPRSPSIVASPVAAAGGVLPTDDLQEDSRGQPVDLVDVHVPRESPSRASVCRVGRR